MNWSALSLVTTPSSGRSATGFWPPVLAPRAHGLDRRQRREPALRGGQLRDVAEPLAGGHALDPRGAAAVADEDDLLLADRLHRALDALVGADDQVQIECACSMFWAAFRPRAGVKKLSPWATILTGLPATASSKDFLIATSSAEALMSYR